MYKVISSLVNVQNQTIKIVRETETEKLKRENLEPIDVSPPKHAMSTSELRQVEMTTTAEIAAMDLGTEGLFLAVGHARVKKNPGTHPKKETDGSRYRLDIRWCRFCTALSGAVTGKYLELVKVYC